MATYKNGISSRNMIVEAARKLFYEKGFRATTYHDISKAANVRIGSISYHFENLLGIAALIDREESLNLHEQMTELLGGEKSAFELAVAEVLIYWHVFFSDEKFRRFHSEFQSAAMQTEFPEYFSAAYTAFRDKYLERNPSADGIEIDLVMAALFGVDEGVNRFVLQHYSELTAEKVFRYSFEIYFSVYHFSREELEVLIENTIETVRHLSVANVCFHITVNRP